jgi:hypothetical protein
MGSFPCLFKNLGEVSVSLAYSSCVQNVRGVCVDDCPEVSMSLLQFVLRLSHTLVGLDVLDSNSTHFDGFCREIWGKGGR